MALVSTNGTRAASTGFLHGLTRTRQAMNVGVAFLLFYFPWAHFPPPRLFRTTVLHVPTWGSGNETSWTLTPFLVPETLLVLALAVAVLISRRRSIRSNALTWVIVSGGLIVAGGLISLWSSSYPGISISGLAGRLTVFILAAVIVLMSPSTAVIRIWTYAAIAGTAVVCAVGLIFFVHSFGFPTHLTDLTGFRVDPRIVDYQKATYGFASNTDDLLVLTLPTAIVLGVSSSVTRSGRAFLFVAVLLMAANMIVSFERWAWICVGVGLLLTAIFYRRSRPRLAYGILIVVGIGGLAVAITQLGAYFGQALQAGSGSNIFDRFQAWGEGLNAVIAHPLGVGFGTEGHLKTLPQSAAHNVFIDIAIEGGILALLGSLLWSANHIGQLVQVIRRARPDDELAFALLLGPAMFVLFGVFFNSLLYLSGLMVWLAFWWTFPAMASALRPEQEGKVSPATEPMNGSLELAAKPFAGP